MCFIRGDDINFGEWYLYSDDCNSIIFHKHNDCDKLKDPDWRNENTAAIYRGPYCTAYRRDLSKVRSCVTCGKKPPDTLIFMLNINRLEI